MCQDVELKGDITIGSGTVIHPKATIFAIAGPIVIGANCIVEESSVIVNRSVPFSSNASASRRPTEALPGAEKSCE